ncbi:MAG: hypothetical protein ACI8W8_003466, partial [Rhodothermales bacterium]
LGSDCRWRIIDKTFAVQGGKHIRTLVRRKTIGGSSNDFAWRRRGLDTSVVRRWRYLKGAAQLANADGRAVLLDRFHCVSPSL